MGAKKARLPLLMRLPRGLREQPAWVFIGIMVALVGVSYMTGFTESSISHAIGHRGLQVWGTFLALSGFGVVYATVAGSPVLEKLALRILSLCMLVYTGWLLTAVDFKRAAMTLVLALILVTLAEIRVAVLRALFRSAVPRGWTDGSQ